MDFLRRISGALVLSLVFVIGLGGCNVEDEPAESDQQQQEDECEEHETLGGCECPDGSTGYQECVDGTFGGGCVCEEEDECEEGDTESGCECPDGSTGYQECVDGSFGGDCVCEEEDECEEGDTEDGCECPDGSTGYQECIDGSFGGDCVCEEEENVCGGTSELIYDGEPVEELGGTCGPCEDGEIACDGEEAVECEGASPAEDCLPTGSVELTAYHEDWAPWQGDQVLSVFLLEDFNRDCVDALDEFGDDAVLQPIENESNVSSPVDTTVEEIPIDAAYTLAAVLHAEQSGEPVGYSVGCADVELTEEDEVEVVDDMDLYELPGETADEYYVELRSHLEVSNWDDKWDDLIRGLELNRDDLAGQLIDCSMGGSCSGGSQGGIDYVTDNWDDVEPFTQSWGIDNLWNRVDHIDDTSSEILGDPSDLWYSFGYVLNDRWETITDSDYGEENELGDNVLVSMETLTAQMDATPGLASDWQSSPQQPWERAFQREQSFDTEELAWKYGLTWSGCHTGGDVPDFGADDCESKTVSIDELGGSSAEAEFTLETHGWLRGGIAEFTVGLPLTDLLDRIWQDQVERLEARHGIAGDFFSTVFNCSQLESDMRDDLDDAFDVSDSEIDELVDAIRPWCDEFEEHGDDFFAAAYKALALDGSEAYDGQDLEFELWEGTVEESLLVEPDPYPSSVTAWQRPLFDELELDISGCEHWMVWDGAGTLEFCVEPTIESTGW